MKVFPFNKPLSIRATLSMVIIAMGILAIVLSLMAVSISHDLTFDNQRDALVRLSDIKANDILKDLATLSGSLGIQLAAETTFKNAYKEKDTQSILTEINQQFVQYYVTANVVNLSKIYVFDIDFNQMAETSKGDTTIPQGVDMCPDLLYKANTRRGSKRVISMSQLCLYNGKPYYSVITAIGGLSPVGYLQVVTEPSHNLSKLENELGMPIRIRLPNDQVTYQSPNWPDKNTEADILLATDSILTAKSEVALNIDIASQVTTLLEKLAQTRYMIIFIALLVTAITVMLVMSLLQRTTVTPLHNLTRQLRQVRQDKSHLGEKVAVKGNIEVRELAEDFNEMTGELKDLYISLEDMAFTDSLTALPNRALFQDRIIQLTELRRREGRKFCVMMMDLDRFKEVNDTLGHEYGDKLLKLVGERLQSVLRHSDTISRIKNDTIARLGGDEFATLLPTAQTSEGAAIVATKICELMSKPVKIDAHTFNVGISIGISMFPKDGDDATTLMRHADIAMYEAKKAHKGFSFYNKELDQHTLENLTLGNELRDSIQHDKLDLHFQPKIDFTSGQICGTEALVRWFHPERGFIPPDQFVLLAEKIGLIEPLTLWVLNRALEQCAHWNHQNIPLGVAINLSAHSLHDSSVITVINEALNDWKVPASSLSLELTESAVMTDPLQALEILSELDGMGVKLSVDDFGTGYSSLSYLKRLPVDEIKIDRSFVMDMFANKHDETIVKSTIDLAHNMNLKVIAEGIEDKETYERLRNMGCDMGQGFFMGRPVSSNDLAQWMDSSPWGLKNKK